MDGNKIRYKMKTITLEYNEYIINMKKFLHKAAYLIIFL